MSSLGEAKTWDMPDLKVIILIILTLKIRENSTFLQEFICLYCGKRLSAQDPP